MRTESSRDDGNGHFILNNKIIINNKIKINKRIKLNTSFFILSGKTDHVNFFLVLYVSTQQ